MEWNIGAGGGLALALVWLYFMCWSSYGIEIVATFAPEYHDTERDTAQGAARARRCSPASSTRCCRSASAARSARQTIADGTATLIASTSDAFDTLVGYAPRPS